jgi:NADP-dependent 3-hydroxy acid dehydrogenase YdfG
MLLSPFKSLINNAGLAMGLDSIQNGDPNHWDIMIDTNVKGLLYISRQIIPHFVKKDEGFVVNIGSLAGYDSYANGAVYCATKFAVRTINEAMKKDLHGTSVRVSMVAPGLVETEFSKVRFEGDEERAAKVYKGFSPLKAKDIAEIVLFNLSRPQHVNILESLVLPTAQSASTMVDRS